MKFKLLLFFIMMTHLLVGQSFDKNIDHLRKHELDSVIFDKQLDDFTKKMVNWQCVFLREYYIYDDFFESIENIEVPKNANKLGSFYFHINKGDYFFYKFHEENQKALNHYSKALSIAQSLNNKQLICEGIKKILNINRLSYLNGNSTYEYYIDLYRKNSYDDLENKILKFYQLSLGFQYRNNEKWDQAIADELVNYARNNNYHLLNAKIFQLLGSYYHRNDNNERAIEFELLAIRNIKKIKFNYSSTFKKIIRISLTRYYLYNNQKNEALRYLTAIDTLYNNTIDQKNNRYIYFYKSFIDSINNDYKSAYINMGKYQFKTEMQNIYSYANRYQELETKHQSEKKSEIIKIEKQRNQYLIIGIFLFAILSYFILANSKRKRLLAIQEKELETQKNLTLLKEQEITTINAMVEGQEKERKRVAEDLHDNLGSVIATLKLHFDNLRINREKKKIDQETLFDKTENLIDEAYKKVRNIAHAKNSGVIANQGLLIAVQMMAEKISSANKIQIEVVDYGLEKPIENSLEISLFRIIQELTTNILKHSKASQATINISQDQDDITILVEDNGVGMNTSEIDHKKGMGLHSIKTRVEHLDGNFTIDSTPTKGTTIIIYIPT